MKLKVGIFKPDDIIKFPTGSYHVCYMFVHKIKLGKKNAVSTNKDKLSHDIPFRL